MWCGVARVGLGGRGCGLGQDDLIWWTIKSCGVEPMCMLQSALDTPVCTSWFRGHVLCCWAAFGDRGCGVGHTGWSGGQGTLWYGACENQPLKTPACTS